MAVKKWSITVQYHFSLFCVHRHLQYGKVFREVVCTHDLPGQFCLKVIEIQWVDKQFMNSSGTKQICGKSHHLGVSSITPPPPPL